MKSLQDRLKGKGLRSSYQRIKILEYLDKNRIHPTVDMIYEGLKQELPSISKTTIYNTLKVFVENGLISGLTISGYETMYDGEPNPHSHFLCKRCGCVMDIEEVECPCLRKEVDGNLVEEVHLYFKGVCKECKRGEK